MTARIRRRTAQALAIEPLAEPAPAASPAEIPPAEAAPAATRDEPTPTAVIHPFPELPAAPARPQPSYRQHVARGRRQNDRQLSLF